MIILVYLHLRLDFVYYEGIYSNIKKEGRSYETVSWATTNHNVEEAGTW